MWYASIRDKGNKHWSQDCLFFWDVELQSGIYRFHSEAEKSLLET